MRSKPIKLLLWLYWIGVAVASALSVAGALSNPIEILKVGMMLFGIAAMVGFLPLIGFGVYLLWNKNKR